MQASEYGIIKCSHDIGKPLYFIHSFRYKDLSYIAKQMDKDIVFLNSQFRLNKTVCFNFSLFTETVLFSKSSVLRYFEFRFFFSFNDISEACLKCTL